MGKPLLAAMVALPLVMACAAEMPGLDFDETLIPDAHDGLVGDGAVRLLSDSSAPPSADARGRGGASGANGGGGGDGGSARDGANGESDGATPERDAGGAGGSGGSGGTRSDAGGAPGDAGGTRNDAATALDVRSADQRSDQTTGSADVASDARGSKPDGASDASSDTQGSPDALGDVITTNDAPSESAAPDHTDDRGGEPDAPIETCGNGMLDPSEECDDGNADPFDGCGHCAWSATHLVLTEIVTRPAGAEMIEIFNPTPVAIALSDYWISDSHLYYEVAAGTFATASGSDFAARFPDGAVLEPSQYAVVALGNASGGTQSFVATYGKAPDFELRPTANQSADDPAVPNMVPAEGGSIGASASLTDAGEPVVLFSYRGGDLVSDVDYVFYGATSTSNPMVDKTGVVRGASTYLADTPATAQRAAVAPGEARALHRCVYAESGETRASGNGIDGHDETSEDVTAAFRVSTVVTDRTPGGPPPLPVCAAK
ncbi:MAG: lamin tail domain-containing protein [Polyangiaceae bacterium]